MTFFSLLIPRWAIFVAGAALVAGLFGWHAHAVNKVEKAAEARVYAKWAESNRIRNEAADAEVKRTTKAQEEIVHDANQKVQSAIADAAAARDASERLRKRFAAAVAAGRCPAAGTVDASPPAGETVDLPSVVFGVLQDHAGQLAEYADLARIAGEACVKSYDSLRER